MLKKLRIGVVLCILLAIFLFYITKSYNFLIPTIILMVINTSLDILITVKEKEYRTYKWIAITDLIAGAAWICIVIIVFSVMKEVYNIVGNDYPKYTLISSLLSFIASMLRNYLKSEEFKLSDNNNIKGD